MRCCFGSRAQKGTQNLFDVADHRMFHRNVFADLCRVNVNMYDFGMRRERLNVTNDTVAEPGADANKRSQAVMALDEVTVPCMPSIPV